ncbi:hypothetical protein KSS87_021087 [Heliosperma pusillum]|nr:hypothetical protein KSS87_021087 [Heliosperma pusillum]
MRHGEMRELQRDRLPLSVDDRPSRFVIFAYDFRY